MSFPAILDINVETIHISYTITTGSPNENRFSDEYVLEKTIKATAIFVYALHHQFIVTFVVVIISSRASVSQAVAIEVSTASVNQAVAVQVTACVECRRQVHHMAWHGIKSLRDR